MSLEIPYKVGQKLWFIGVGDEAAVKCECCDTTKSWKPVYTLKEDVIEQINVYIQDKSTTLEMELDGDNSQMRFGNIYMDLEDDKWKFKSCYACESKDEADTKLKELNEGVENLPTRSDFMNKLMEK